jgi:hypothetical protein
MSRTTLTPKPYLNAENARKWFERNTISNNGHRLIATMSGGLENIVTDRVTESPARSLAIAYFNGLEDPGLVAYAVCNQSDCTQPEHLEPSHRRKPPPRKRHEFKQPEFPAEFDDVAPLCSHPVPPTEATVAHCNGCNRSVEKVDGQWRLTDQSDRGWLSADYRDNNNRIFTDPDGSWNSANHVAASAGDDMFNANFNGPLGNVRRRHDGISMKDQADVFQEIKREES